MHYMKLAAVAALSMVTHNFPKDNTLPITRRIAVAAEQTKQEVKRWRDKIKEKFGTVRPFFTGDSLSDQKRRLNFYLEHETWFKNPKRLVVWIMTGVWQQVNPDGRTSDAQYQEFYVLFKKLLLDRELSYEEEVAFRQEALEKIYAYRYKKGLPKRSRFDRN